MKNEQLESKILWLLNGTERAGIDNLIDAMFHLGFFESPASISHHGAFPGGLAQHSLRVYDLLQGISQKRKVASAERTEHSSIVMAGLLHNFSKIGKYITKNGKFKHNEHHPKGHAMLSVEMIRGYTDLTALEVYMIKYHMGIYGTYEFSKVFGEYSLVELLDAWEGNPIIKMLYICDEMAAAEGL